MTAMFDPLPYLQVPTLNRDSAVGLVAALLANVPANATSTVQAGAARLDAAAKALQTELVVVERSEAADGGEAVIADRSLDNAWAAFRDRLSAPASLPIDRFPMATRAQEICDRLFADGLSFLRLPYPEEWAVSERQLEAIEKEGLKADVETLAGPEYLAEVKRAHERFGAVLGQGKTGPKVRIAERMREVSQAIEAYALQVLATADATQPETVEAARRALAPIDELRAANARRRAPRKAVAK